MADITAEMADRITDEIQAARPKEWTSAADQRAVDAKFGADVRAILRKWLGV